jgi:membrane protease YdiL (CAAX protease family)
VAVGVGVTLVLLVGIGVAVGILAAALAVEPETFDVAEGPVGFVFGNLLLAAAIPVSVAAVVLAFLRPPGWLMSVTLRLRWRWLAVCAAWLTGWALVTTAVWFLLDGVPSTGGEDALLLIGLCLLTTPLQAAGEEFLVRGWLSQSIGAWFARPVLGAVVAALASATVFALLHGSQNAWLFGDRFVFGLVASYLVWRTGGLEAAIALHTISNVAAIVPSALEGTLDESLTLTEAPVGTVLLDVVTLLLATALVVWLARRHRPERLGPPPPSPSPVAPEPYAAR